jgi:hypothetical protein
MGDSGANKEQKCRFKKFLLIGRFKGARSIHEPSSSRTTTRPLSRCRAMADRVALGAFSTTTGNFPYGPPSVSLTEDGKPIEDDAL